MVEQTKLDFRKCPFCENLLTLYEDGSRFCGICNKGWYPESSLIHKSEIIKEVIIGTIEEYYCPSLSKYVKAFVKERIERLVCEEIDHKYYVFECRTCGSEQVIYIGYGKKKFKLEFIDLEGLKQEFIYIFRRGTPQFKNLIEFTNDLMLAYIVDKEQEISEREVGLLDKYACPYCNKTQKAKILEQIVIYGGDYPNTLRFYIIVCSKCGLKEVFNMGDMISEGRFSNTDESALRGGEYYISEQSGRKNEIVRGFIENLKQKIKIDKMDVITFENKILNKKLINITFENKSLNKKLAKLNDAPIIDSRTKLLITLGAEINFPEMLILYNKLEIEQELKFQDKRSRSEFFNKLNNLVKEVLDKAVVRAIANKRKIVNEIDL